MDFTILVSFLLVAALLVVSPGPNGLLITNTVSLSSKRYGFANIAGFVAAFYLHGTLSILGLSLLLVQSAQAFTLFKVMGAAYLIWLGLKSLRAAMAPSPGVEHSNSNIDKTKNKLSGAFWQGFLTNGLNPKVSIFYLAAFPQFLSVGEGPASALLLVSLHAMVNVLWFSVMIFALAKVKKVGQSPRFRVWLNSFSGLFFIGFGAKLALSKSQ